MLNKKEQKFMEKYSFMVLQNLKGRTYSSDSLFGFIEAMKLVFDQEKVEEICEIAVNKAQTTFIVTDEKRLEETLEEIRIENAKNPNNPKYYFEYEYYHITYALMNETGTGYVNPVEHYGTEAIRNLVADFVADKY